VFSVAPDVAEVCCAIRGRMIKEEAPLVRQRRLSRRILLLGSTGALPLFLVGLLLISVAYGDALEFALQEQRGNAFERRLERLLYVLPSYQLAARRGAAAEAEAARGEIDQALKEVLSAGETEELGRALRFTSGGPEARSLRALRDSWQALAHEPLSVAANAQGTDQVVQAARVVIQVTGDRSNLILDHDLDSYYLMDVTLGALPQAQQRMLEIRQSVVAWRDGQQLSDHGGQIAVMAAMLREADLARRTRTSTALARRSRRASRPRSSASVSRPSAC
jgi:hypothetical protein